MTYGEEAAIGSLFAIEGVEIWKMKKRRSGLSTAGIRNCSVSTMGNRLKSGIQREKLERENAFIWTSTIQRLDKMYIISVTLQSGWKRWELSTDR